MHIATLTQNIIRLAKHYNPNLKRIEFSLTIGREELERDSVLREILNMEDERDIYYLKGFIDGRKRV